MPSPSNAGLTREELDRCPPGTQVEVWADGFRIATATRDWQGFWLAPGLGQVDPNDLVGAKICGSHPLPHSSAGLTQSMWLGGAGGGGASTASVGTPFQRRPRPPVVPVTPPRVLKVGDRAPTSEEACRLPDGSLIIEEHDDWISAWKKVGARWLNIDGDDVGNNWTASREEVVVRVGPDFAAPMPVNADEVIALLMHDPSILAAVRAKVPDLRELADEIERILAHRTGS